MFPSVVERRCSLETKRCVSVCLSVSLFVCLSICLFIYLSVGLFLSLFVCRLYAFGWYGATWHTYKTCKFRFQTEIKSLKTRSILSVEHCNWKVNDRELPHTVAFFFFQILFRLSCCNSPRDITFSYLATFPFSRRSVSPIGFGRLNFNAKYRQINESKEQQFKEINGSLGEKKKRLSLILTRYQRALPVDHVSFYWSV